MAKTVSSPFLIGVFVLGGTILLVVALIWLGASQFFKEHKKYVTYFDGSVEGLEKGSPVKYQGVTCGSIRAINVAPDGRLIEVIMQIEMKIDINDSIRVYQTMSGIAGGKFLQLHYPTNPEMSKIHPELTFKPEFDLIKSAPSSLEEIQYAALEVVNNLRLLDVQTISMKTIEFLESSTEFVTRKEFNQILTNLANSTKNLNNIIAELDSTEIIANFQYSSELLVATGLDLQKTVNNLDNKLKELDLNGTLDKVYNKYDSTMTNANKSINRVAFRAESVIFGLNDAFEELRRTNFELQKSLRAISDHPAQIFLSEPPPKEK